MLQTKSKRTEIGQSERSVTDKKRQRRQKKKFQHFTKDKMQRMKEKQDRSLSSKKSSGDGYEAVKSSDKFFEKLSEKVKDHVKVQKRSELKNTDNRKHHKLRHLKL